MAEEPEEEKKARRAASEKARSSLPAAYVDTWSVLRWRGHLRITLAEWMYGAPNYRAAFLMESEDAERLANYILELIERQRKEDAEEDKANVVESATDIEEP